MTSIRDMAKLFVWMLCILLVALDLSEGARNRNRSRKGNRQSKRQKNSEISEEGTRTVPDDCFDLNKKVLRLKYEIMERGTNVSRVPGVAMLPAPARPMHYGITFMPPTSAPRVGTCPHTAVQNYDGTRWPRVIMEANCKCDHCYLGLRRPGPNSESCPNTTNPDLPEGYCSPIMREIAVLRRAGCVGDFARYDWDVANVSVGCECVIGSRPRPSG